MNVEQCKCFWLWHRHTIFCAFLYCQPGASRSLLEKMMDPEVSQTVIYKSLNTHTGSSGWQISVGFVAYQCTIIHILFVFSLIFLFKVLSDKALPVLCLFAILVYWTLGLSLPSTGNLLEEDVSECVSLF